MSNNPEKVVLIVSTGRQDLKFWASAYSEEEKKYYLATFRIGNCREFHEHLLHDHNFYQIKTYNELVGRFPNRITKQPDIYFDWDECTSTVKPMKPIFRDRLGLPNAKNGPLKFEPLREEGRFILAPAKLAHTVDWLKEEQRKGNLQLTAALFFATCREKTVNLDHYKGEPIATGHVLALWLADRFPQLKYAEVEGERFNEYDICWINFLKGLEDYSGAGPDAPVHRLAVRYIDDAVHSIAKKHPSALALLSDTGGMADVKACLNASVHFRFRNNIAEIPETETFAEPLDLKQLQRESRVPSRRDSLEARNHCEQRLWQGDFLGAWGAVAHLKDNPDDKDWVGAVKQMADFFLGVELASKALFPELQIVLNSHQNVLRAAFKVEAALQGLTEDDRRMADAILGTVNFYDVALRSKINQIVKTFKGVEFIGDEMDGKVRFKDAIPSEYCIERKFFIAEKKKYLISIGKDRDGDKDWLQWLKDNGFGSLKNYNDHLSREIKDIGKSIRTYRNYVAHRALSHQDAQNAMKIAEKNQLWNLQPCTPYDATQLGQHFLDVLLTRNVLQLFDIDNAAALYRNLVTGLIGLVRSPIHYAEP